MPRAITRSSVLAEARAEHAALEKLISLTPKTAWTAARVNSAGWSLKDVVAHLADWSERLLGWIDDGFEGRTPSPPGDGFTWRETRELNHAIFLKRRRHSLARVLRDYRAAHAALIRHARTLDSKDLLKQRRFEWTGPSWSIGHHIRAATAAHDRWANKHFKKQLRLIESGPVRTGTRPRAGASARSRR